jgi:hypothetical protein
VHPAVGPVEPGALIDGFLSALGGGSSAERVMALQWRAAGLVVVDRARPLTMPSGKVLHLHQRRDAVGGESRKALSR